MVRVTGGPRDLPLYFLEKRNDGLIISEDSATGIVAAIKRIFYQIIGKRDYKLQHVAEHIAASLDNRSKEKNLGQATQGQLSERDIKIMGRLSRIPFDTWKEISLFGQKLVFLSYVSQSQSDDVTYAQVCQVHDDHRKVYDLLQSDTELQALCKTFIKKCPSIHYCSIVQLVLND